MNPRTSWRFGLLCLLLTALLVLADARAETQRLGEACQLDSAISATVLDWLSGTVRPALALELADMAQWAGEDIWRSEGSYGVFDMPDAAPEASHTYTVTLASGDVQTVDVSVIAGTVYVFGYNSLEVSTDANGHHPGLHDLCSYFRLET